MGEGERGIQVQASAQLLDGVLEGGDVFLRLPAMERLAPHGVTDGAFGEQHGVLGVLHRAVVIVAEDLCPREGDVQIAVGRRQEDRLLVSFDCGIELALLEHNHGILGIRGGRAGGRGGRAEERRDARHDVSLHDRGAHDQEAKDEN